MSQQLLVNVIDVEATCWDKDDTSNVNKTHEIIEIGITVVNLHDMNIISTESILVKPTYSKVSPFCTRLTTLTQAQLDEDGISLKEAAHILATKYHSATRLFASYGDYDAVQFRKELSSHHIPYIFNLNRHCNVKALYAQWMGLRNQVGMVTALTQVGIRLQGTHHRGSDDSRNIAQLLLHIITLLVKNTSSQEQKLLKMYHLLDAVVPTSVVTTTPSSSSSSTKLFSDSDFPPLGR